VRAGGCLHGRQPTRRQVLSERGGLDVVERRERARGTAPAGDGGEKRGEEGLLRHATLTLQRRARGPEAISGHRAAHRSECSAEAVTLRACAVPCSLLHLPAVWLRAASRVCLSSGAAPLDSGNLSPCAAAQQPSNALQA
jgi:hypothetical protein